VSNETNNPVTPPVKTPANPAKGNLRGQTTLAAKIDKMQILVDNLAPKVEQMPGLKDQFTQLQAMLASAKALRNRLKTLAADSADAMTQRNEMIAASESLFQRVQLGLQSVHGPKSDRLHEFGLKPRRPRTGRPKKTQTPAVPPPVEPAPPARQP
jgi:hypothetical protein